MKPLPITDKALVLRTDFTDDAAWKSVCDAVRKPSGRNFEAAAAAHIDFVSEPDYDGLTVSQLLTLVRKEEYRSAIYLVDKTALSDIEQPILVADVRQKPGRTFRVVPRELYHIDNEWFANMPFKDVAALAESDGVFRMESPQSDPTPQEEAAAKSMFATLETLTKALSDSNAGAAMKALIQKLDDRKTKG